MSTAVVGLTTYTFLKFVHVLLAIVAVGSNATYGIWLARAGREPEHLGYVLRGIKVLDDRLRTPRTPSCPSPGSAWCGSATSTLPSSGFWLATSLGVYSGVMILGLGVYTPTLRKQIRALDEQGTGSDEFQALSTRGTVVGVVLAVMIIAIVYMMVAKPTI